MEKEQINFKDRNLFLRFMKAQPYNYRPYFNDWKKPINCGGIGWIIFFSILILGIAIFTKNFLLFIISVLSIVVSLSFVIREHEKYYKKIFWKHFTIRK